MQYPAARPTQPLKPLVITLAAAWGASALPALADDATRAPTVVVVGQTPLPGLDQPIFQIPAPVQFATDKDVDRVRVPDLSAFMNRSLSGVHINEIQGNPFQADVNYRGYTASPLAGTPQGLSVYLDGVRINQPFGDVVSWDMIPRSAIASVTLMPGSNPLFGLNTLGGALALTTKDGRTHPGASVQVTGGSYGRRSVEFEHGGFNDKGLEWFVTGNLFHEDGWRAHSPSDVHQFFGKAGWQNATTDIDLSLAVADNRLNGNGLQERRFLDQDWHSVYTSPDITKNNSMFLNLTGRHSLSDDAILSGNAYYRRIAGTTFNGDVNEGALDQSVYQPNAAERSALAAAGYSGYPTSGANASNTPFPSWRCIANALLNDEPNEKCTGLLNRTSTTQRNFGLSGQLSVAGTLAGRPNQFTAGAAYDQSQVNFRQSAQFGYINPDHTITPVDAYADGTQTSENAFDARVDLNGRTRTWSVFATDTLALAEKWHATLSGRYNTTTVKNRDALNPGGGSASLDGDHRFSRFNPAAGITFSPTPALNAYLGYTEGSRTPTAIELGCANPDNPCKLPNAMAGDPPLNQVVTRTWDAGLRGRLGAETRWNAGVFRAVNSDDILFVADNQSGYGYFRNFGKTRRQGVELGASTRVGALNLSANYTWLDATYQSEELLGGSGNSSSDAASAGLDGNIRVRPGDRIPLIPRQILKLSADYRVTPALAVGADLVGVSGSTARGNENGQHQADGTYYLDGGRSAGYSVINLNSTYQASRGVQIFGQIGNLFDRRYTTAAQLGSTAFSSSGGVLARPFASVGGEFPLVHSTFYAPGAPRTLWVGLRYSL
ncbi:MAG TPA: TonB-dependent receptor [Rhodocyclaceae bacterium]|nr:TonB-dependent receptor [Rhodocyclaceae bacterium]